MHVILSNKETIRTQVILNKLCSTKRLLFNELDNDNEFPKEKTKKVIVFQHENEQDSSEMMHIIYSDNYVDYEVKYI